jgi:diacylglycerol kinase family enzyme
LSSLGAGFDAAVAWRALRGPVWIGGLPRYLLATLQEITALQLADLRITLDGRPVHSGQTLFASTLNTPSYGGGMPAVPGARIADGRLDLLLAGRFGRAGALAMLPRLLVGRHLGHAEVRTWAFEQLLIEAEAPLPLAADGEGMAAARRAEVRVLPAVLPVVMAPAGTSR